MADSTIWWLLAGGAVALELASGSLYLLMFGVGLAAAALAAHAGGGMATQLVTAAVVCSGAVGGWYLVKRGQPPPLAAGANPDANMDVGEAVQVNAWAPDATATVRYRGANWTVVAHDGEHEGPGQYRIREVTGSRLVVEKV
jgi:membrane protein implicated in regulation of membrane protease activity